MNTSNNQDQSSSHQVENHGQEMDHDMSMMKNYFHFGFGDTILIHGWVLQSTGDLIAACFIFFTLAVFYEGLKTFREFLFRQNTRAGAYRISVLNPTNGCPDDLSANLSSLSNQVTSSTTNEAIINCSMWSKAHLLQSLLHVVQIFSSYTLMMGFMSLNIWICLSIVLGAGLGYFIFCSRKLTFVNSTDHCN